MPKTNVFIIFLLTAAVVFLLVDRFSTNEEVYPLQNEVESIQKEFYLYYLSKGEYPKAKDFLSLQSQRIISAYPDRFRWDENQVYLHFKASVPAKFTPTTIGKPGDTFEHNCKVYLAHAPWVEGFKEDYQASETELKNAGVQLN